jgi:hypothetical protein
MGANLSRQAIEKGHEVFGYDPSEEAPAESSKAGLRPAGSIEELALSGRLVNARGPDMPSSCARDNSMELVTQLANYEIETQTELRRAGEVPAPRALDASGVLPRAGR